MFCVHADDRLTAVCMSYTACALLHEECRLFGMLMLPWLPMSMCVYYYCALAMCLYGFATQVNRLSVGGGGDYPEDVLGALHQATAFDWQSKARFMLQIGDAPPHGTEFNSGTGGDDYPCGLPSGLTGGSVMSGLKDKSIDLMLGKVGGHQ